MSAELQVEKSTEFKKFVEENLNSDLDKLLFSPPKDIQFDIRKAVDQIYARRKIKPKVPQWYHLNELILPPPISIEQASSQLTAEYKASQFSGSCLLDATGGTGIDTFYLSSKFDAVVCLEKDKRLVDLLSHNFKILGAENIEVIHASAEEYLKNVDEIFDLVYVDPSRRTERKERIFALEDSSPDIFQVKEDLLRIGNRVLIKTFPMLDITDTIKRLEDVSDVYAVSVKGELKEVLYLLDHRDIDDINYHAVNLLEEHKQSFNFKESERDLSKGVEVSLPLKFLYEPNSSILKMQGTKVLAKRFNLSIIGGNSHFLTSDQHIEEFPGKVFSVSEEIVSRGKALKKRLVNSRYNVISRNYFKTANQICRDYNIKSGTSEDFLVFTKGEKGNPIILEAKRLFRNPA